MQTSRHSSAAVACCGLAMTLLCGCPGKTDSPDGGSTIQDGSVTPDAGSDGGVVGPTVGLRTAATDARACELVITDPDRAVKGLAFGAGAEGRLVREGERVAVAFFTRADGAISAEDLGLELVPSGSAANLGISISRCFDRTGHAIAGATVEVVR